jgi:hypothetical protein
MKTQTRKATVLRGARLGVLAGMFLGSALLAGCAGQPGTSGSDFGQVNLAPGKTAACYTDPCTILFAMPPGKGSYVVRANNQLVGTYPAGQVADLGDFFKENSPITITVDGTDAKPAILWITGNM